MASAKRGEITLGGHTYTVVAQPLAYLEMELGDVFGQLNGVKKPDDLAGVAVGEVIEQDGTPADTPPGRQGFGEIAGPGYDILRVFIPDLMPEHEFRGYVSEDAFAAGLRDKGAMRLAPTIPQIVDAFETVFRINRLDVVKHLGKVVPRTLIEGFMKEAIGDSISQLLSSSLPASGE